MATTVQIRHGNEGPQHDPYSYVEVTVTRNGVRYTGHFGLLVYVEAEKDGETIRSTQHDHSDEYLEELFKSVTGGYAHEWELWQAKARSRCRACGNKHLMAVRGYPGEVIHTCPKCDEVAFCSFNRRAVE